MARSDNLPGGRPRAGGSGGALKRSIMSPRKEAPAEQRPSMILKGSGAPKPSVNPPARRTFKVENPVAPANKMKTDSAADQPAKTKAPAVTKAGKLNMGHGGGGAGKRAEKAETSKGKKLELKVGRAPTFGNDRDGTGRYRNNQNAGGLKPGAPPPLFPGNGQNAGGLKNGGAGWTSPGPNKKGGLDMGHGGGKGGGGNGRKPKIEDPPLPPSPPPASPPPPPPPAPAPAQYQNKDWTKVVGHYFPESPGMKAGGLVRGGGAAMKGRGRGRIV